MGCSTAIPLEMPRVDRLLTERKEGTMRSLSRGVVIGALALPLAFAGAGLAAAHPDHHGSAKHHHAQKWDWDWKFNWKHTHISDDDNIVVNSGIIG